MLQTEVWTDSCSVDSIVVKEEAVHSILQYYTRVYFAVILRSLLNTEKPSHPYNESVIRLQQTSMHGAHFLLYFTIVS